MPLPTKPREHPPGSPFLLIVLLFCICPIWGKKSSLGKFLVLILQKRNRHQGKGKGKRHWGRRGPRPQHPQPPVTSSCPTSPGPWPPGPPPTTLQPLPGPPPPASPPAHLPTPLLWPRGLLLTGLLAHCVAPEDLVTLPGPGPSRPAPILRGGSFV